MKIGSNLFSMPRLKVGRGWLDEEQIMSYKQPNMELALAQLLREESVGFRQMALESGSIYGPAYAESYRKRIEWLDVIIRRRTPGVIPEGMVG